MTENLELERAEVQANTLATEDALAQAQRKGQAMSAATTVLVHLVIAILLALVFIPLGPEEIPQIVAVSNESRDHDSIKKKDFARSVQQKPMPAQSASRVQPLTAAAVSPVSVPSIENPVEDPMGIGVDFGKGFGYGKGTGGGGGGGTITFFGSSAKANRVVYIVDFSGSMEQVDAGGGTRLAKLKKELGDSISKLPKGVDFQVIYYSTAPWLGGETLFNAPTRFPDEPADRIPWSRATKDGIQKALTDLAAAQPKGATLWGPPLELATAMRPAPSAIFLLSDGEAQDREEVLDELDRINPQRIPINVIGLELVGPAFGSLVTMARRTGGTYSIVVKGRLFSGAAALQYGGDDLDPIPDL